jgi:large subunit ribosomal protein L35
MPKLKTKSSTKGRFTITGSGKIRRGHAKHRHGLSKQEKKVRRSHRGLSVMDKTNTPAVKRWMPYL